MHVILELEPTLWQQTIPPTRGRERLAHTLYREGGWPQLKVFIASMGHIYGVKTPQHTQSWDQ